MPRFFTGDELGTVKAVTYSSVENGKEWKASASVLVPGSSSSRSKTVQKLALHHSGSDTLVPTLGLSYMDILLCSCLRVASCSAC